MLNSINKHLFELHNKKAKLNFKNDFRTPFENRLKLHLQSLLDNI